jgi:putative nucleotidyltransferase with HDIG domain
LFWEKRLHKADLANNKFRMEVFNNLDSITYRHSLNVARYAVQFTKSCGCNLSRPLVFYSGLLHDIGKVQVETTILNKTAALTKNEFSKIKQHPVIGYSILQRANFPDEILNAALFHHERCDGKGYPMGYKKEQIPLIARIISICDVFDALTSDRPYRKAYSVDRALQIMSNSAGQFDNSLLLQFMKNILGN